MGFNEGRITLDSPTLTYYAGQTIFGKLEFQQDKIKTFRGIHVTVTGSANVHWTTDHQRRVNDRTEHYKKNHDAYEEYFRVKQYLVGSANGETKLHPGRQEFPFQCHIPAHCPSSFEGKYGHIRYEIHVVLDRVFMIDQEKRISICVVAPYDLNTNPSCKLPAVFQFNESYCCCCMGNGSVDTLVKLPVSGYCPGQVIPVEISCTNNSEVEVKIKLNLKKHIVFHANHEPGTKYDEDTLVEIKKGPVVGKTTRNWNIEMMIPEMDSTNVDSCHIIDINYRFKVKICPGGCHSSTSATKSILMGTEPLDGFQDEEIKEYEVPNPQPVQDNNTLSLYPGQAQVYPGSNTPYPTPNAGYPGAASPYPGSVSPNPGAALPYPGAASPYPPPYPGNNETSYPNPPYPGPNPGYPGANSPPHLNPSMPYPPGTTPYPVASSPFPPKPSLGFNIEAEKQNSPAPMMPMPQAAGAAAPASWAPSAPVPSTPDAEKTLDPYPPYNPEFMKLNGK